MKTNETLKLIGDKEFLDKIYQFSYRRCNTSYEAEDLCSEIILAVISAVHNQESIENFYAFVWTIARRVYADYSEKRNQTRQTISIENSDLLLAAKENEIDSFIEEATEQEQIKKIFAEISFLSKAYREVMVLYYLDEMKVKDIALKLGINETTVKQRLFSARNTVRKEVETMNERNLSLKPITMDFMGSGSVTGNSPASVASRTFSQNLIYACKDTAKSAKELSEELCVPMIYVEEELEIQLHGINGTFGTLRKQGDKYISNIIIVDEQDRIEVSKLYEKYTDKFCETLQKYLKDNETIMAKGSVRKKGKKWYYRFYVEDESGNRVQKEFPGTESKSETESMLRKAMETYESTQFVAQAKSITLADMLEMWIEDEVKPSNRSNGTLRTYSTTVGYISKQPIGKRKLQSIKTEHLQKFFDDLNFLNEIIISSCLCEVCCIVVCIIHKGERNVSGLII